MDQYSINIAGVKAGFISDIDRNNEQGIHSGLRHSINVKPGLMGVRSVNVTSDDRYIIITFENSPMIRVVDLDKLEYLPCEYPGHTDSVRLTSITRDNRAFFTASWDGSSRKFIINSGACTQVFSGFGRSPSCYLDPDEKYLFTASYDSDYGLGLKNCGRCWELSSGNICNKYNHTDERINHEAIDIACDERGVYTGSDDGRAYRWELQGTRPALHYFKFDGTVRKIAVSRHYFAAACTDGVVRVHSKQSGERYRYFVQQVKDIREVRIAKDESKLWSASGDGTVFCYNLITGELLFQRKVLSLWIWSICLMRNEKMLICGGWDGAVTFLNAETGQILGKLHVIPGNKDVLITCPPDKAFPGGIFYTTNTNYIQVYRNNKERNTREKLDRDDHIRHAYINKFNLKNLVISRLKFNEYYATLTEHHTRHQDMLSQVHRNAVPRMLRA